MTPVFELTGVTKSFRLPNGENLSVLRQIDASIPAGEITAIVGRSGSGKSTLLNLLGLLDSPTTGTLCCNGVNAKRLSDAERSRLRGSAIGFVFQQFHLLDRRTALENVGEPLLFGSRAGARARAPRAHSLLDAVGLRERAGSMPHVLSGGEQQRVAIARALIREPQILLADEPTGSLDETTGELVLDLLIGLVKERGLALVLVTHDRAVAARANRILTLADGQLQETT